MRHNKWLALIAFTSACVFPFIPCNAQNLVKIQFDSNKEVSGQKFAIRDISHGLPSNWDPYNFVVLEFKSTTPQRFQVGFTTETGYNELRVMSYTANGWNKLAIPLKFFREIPGAALDLAATYNQERYTGWINLGGKRGPLRGVDSIGIRMNVPVHNPVFELRSIALSIEDPGDQYLGKIPVVDEFGQWNLGVFEGKIKSMEQLKKEWYTEENEVISTKAYNYSKFGGYLNAKVNATGFFRTEKIEDHWWFVDPEGYLFLSNGVDCVNAGGGGNAINIDKRRNLYKVLPPAEIGTNPEMPNSASFGTWNLFHRYGKDYPDKSKDMIIKRMDKWGLNTIANWSNPEVTQLNRKAFMLQLRGVGIEDGVMGLPDVYTPEFTSKIDAACKAYVGPYKENPWLIGYFTGNEPSWLEQEVRLCGMILDGRDKPIKTALKKYLSAGDPLPLFASPWSPPAWMKDNQDVLHGGKLLPRFSQAWANHYVKFIKAYEAVGIPVWGISVQNEPMAKQKWESCIFTAEEERDFIKNYLGPTLYNNGMKDKKLIAWDHNRDLIYQRAAILLSDAEAAKYIWGIGFHWYETWTGSGMQFENLKRVKEAFPDKNLIFTEGCVEKFSLDRVNDWSLGEKYGYSMVNDFNCGTVAWTDWNILLDETGGPNHVGNFFHIQ